MRTFSLTNNPKIFITTILTASLALAGCGASGEAEQPPAPTVDEEVTSGPDEVEETHQDDAEDAAQPVGEFSTEVQQSDDWPAFQDTAGIYPIDVRAAVHGDFERIVIEHAGTGTPSYMAQYTDQPMEPGIGNPVNTGDAAYLEVIASGTASIDDIDESRMIDHGEQITDLETQVTGTVVSFAPWEATSNYFIGLDSKRPYAVAILEDPVRIVIDIQLENEQ